MVRGADSLKNGAEFSILGVDMVFMDLDSSVNFYFICSEVCSDLEHFWDVFTVQFSPYHCEMWGFCMGKVILAVKPSMCRQILITPDV